MDLWYIIKHNKNGSKRRVEKRDFADWIVAVGKHEGIIPSKKWIEVQKILDGNTDKRYRRPSESNALLSGILRCEHCGSFMRTKLRRHDVSSDGRRVFDYMCELKDKSRKQKCQCKNISGLEADDLVMEKIKELLEDKLEVEKYKRVRRY